jgi:prepilin-type N-terminal cleavage/methylation domain-containing protein
MITMSPTPARKRTGRARGFTLVELLIATALSSVLLAAVLTSFLMLGRSGTNLANYSEMESQARVSLERFAQDVRQAANIVWTSETNVTLSFNGLPDVTYALGGTGNTQFIRTVHSTPVQSSVLISNVLPATFKMSGYTVTGYALPVSTATERLAANRDTKQLQLQLNSFRKSVTVNRATNTVLSARFILRNKRVTS